MENVLTNRYLANVDYEKISEDFDIFRITKESQHLEKCDVLDFIAPNIKPLGVVYSWGRNAFMLFQKGKVSKDGLQLVIQKEYPEVSVHWISKMELLDENFRKDNFYFNDRLLVQLFANSLRNPMDEQFQYKNITGKLYYPAENANRSQSWKRKTKTKSFVNIQFEPDMYIALHVVTFSKEIRKGQTQYLFDKNTSEFRRRVQVDKDCKVDDIYTKSADDEHHAVVPQFSFGKIADFNECKLGILRKFLDDFEKSFGKYISFNQQQMPTAIKLESKGEYEPSNIEYGKMLSEKGIIIEDLCKDSYSSKLSEILREQLIADYQIPESKILMQKSTQDSFNVRIIHVPEYYEEKEIEDPHKTIPSDYITQHLNIENFQEEIEKEKESHIKAALHKVVQELIIKNDIKNGKISVTDWKKYGFSEPVTFVIREKTKNESQEDESAQNDGTKKENHFLYKTISIEPDGKFSFTAFDDKSEIKPFSKESKMKMAFENYHKKYHKINNTVEALFYFDIENIHAIVRTNEFTMPNIFEYYNALKKADDRTPVSIVDLKNDLDDFAKGESEYWKPEYSKNISELKKRLDSEFCGKLTVPKKEIKKLINMRTNFGSAFNRFYDMAISAEQKSSDLEERYLLGNITDINYIERTNYLEEKYYSYFIGPKNPNLSIAHSCIVRNVYSEDCERNEFEKIVRLLEVEFVRNKQFTVLPFPVKYLREWRG